MHGKGLLNASGPCRARPGALFLFLFGCFHVDDFAVVVVTTLGAHVMRQVHLAAVVAHDQVCGCQSVVGAPAIAASGRMFAFRMRWHVILLIIKPT